MKCFKRKQVLFCAAGLAALFVSCTPQKSSTPEARLKWDTASLKSGYESSGRKDARWDKDAEDAFTQFARIHARPDEDSELGGELAAFAAENAMTAGCKDPMIQFIHLRYDSPEVAVELKKRQAQYLAAAKDMEAGAYSPLWKFYANVFAAERLWLRRDTNLWDEVWQLRERAVANFSQALTDKTMPPAETYEAADALFQMLERNTSELTNAYNAIQGILLNDKSKQTEADLIRADFYLMYAWRARGNDTADKVTAEGWQLFKERLDEAEKALNHAWASRHDAEIARLMISVALGQQKPREEMEKWFQRAMAVEPDDYKVCRAKLHFLLPQWYGSREDMVAFGRECVASTNWGGHVPLILVDAHSDFARTLSDADERRAYWRLPDVWPDIQSAYEKFSRLNPNATRFRYPYARYAFRCGQWQDFKDQIALIRQNDAVKVRYFGGQEAFDQMMSVAGGKIP